MISVLLKSLGIDPDQAESGQFGYEDETAADKEYLWSAERYPDDDEADEDDFVGGTGLFGEDDDDDDDDDSGRDTSLKRKQKMRQKADDNSDSDAFLEEGIGSDQEDSDLFSSGAEEEYETHGSQSEDEYSSDSEEQYDVYERDRPYEYSQIEKDLFLLREAGSTEKFVILAHEAHPLVPFTRNLRLHEKNTLRSLLGRAPEEVESLQDGRIPGVLTHFVVEKLYRAPKFVMTRRDGTEVLVDSMPEKHLVPERPESIDLNSGEPEESAELFVLDPEDVDYDAKYQALVDITSGRRGSGALDRFEYNHNRGNLSRFRATGHTGEGFDASSEVFETVSPVSEHSGAWYCIKMHYYAMFKSFMGIHDRTHTMLQDLVKRRQTAEEAGQGRYCYGSPDPASEEKYTAAQERAVLDRIIEAVKQNERADYMVAVKREELLQTAGQIVRRLPALRNEAQKEKSSDKSVLPLYAMDAEDTLSELCRMIEALKSSIEMVNSATKERFSD